MSANDSTTSTPTDKPAKPYPDFPLFPHATKRWAKKIKGKMYYFGSWDDWQAALAKYEREKDALEAGLTPTPADHTLTPAPAGRKANKPKKPYPDFPLFPHASGQWAKKIQGQLHYFGKWDNWRAALENYDREKDALYAGETPPRPDAAPLTVKDVANGFMEAKAQAIQNGELSRRTWLDYRSIMEMMAKGLGPRRIVTNLTPPDFRALKNKLAERNGLHRMGTIIQVIRCAFKWAYEEQLLDRPIRFGPAFKRADKKTFRVHRAKQGEKLFTAGEVRRLIDAAGPSMRAMILLGINCGFGNSDCGNLPLSAVDLEKGIIAFPRPKTGMKRRGILWPETVQAIREALANRPGPKNREDAGLVFLTKYGTSWSKEENAGPVTQEMRKLLNRLGINGHRNFYTLRHTFRTIADESKDQPAVDYTMGHEVPHMSSVYRETISDDRLRAVADHVRRWLFPSVYRISSVE